MSITPLISIVTISRNLRNEISDTIESVINQTYSRIEYIVIDGNSDDGTVELIRRYRDGINQFISESDTGIYNAMNKGLFVASGDFVTFLNGGDTYSNLNCICQLVSKLEDLDRVYFGNATITDENTSWAVPPTNKKEQVAQWLTKYHPCHQTVFYPKIFYKYNNYNELLGISADTDYTLRAYHNYKFTHVDIQIAKFRLGGTSNQVNSLVQASVNIRSQMKLRRTNRTRYPIRSDLLFLLAQWIKFLLFKLGGKDLQHKGMYFSKFIYWKNYIKK